MNTYILLAVAGIYLILALYYYNRTHLFLLWLSYLPTLLHEFGHAIMCQLSGGKVNDIVIVTGYSERRLTSRSGFAETQTYSGLNRFVTFISGYMFPPLVLLAGVYCVMHGWTILFWILLGLIFLYYFIKTSRKLFPIVVMTLIFGGVYLLYRYPETVSVQLISEWSVYGVLGILLADTLLSSYTITLVYFQGNKTWDGAMLSRLTRLPVLLYYLLFVTVQLGSCWLVVRMMVW